MEITTYAQQDCESNFRATPVPEPTPVPKLFQVGVNECCSAAYEDFKGKEEADAQKEDVKGKEVADAEEADAHVSLDEASGSTSSDEKEDTFSDTPKYQKLNCAT